MQRTKALVFSSWINAWSLYKAAKRLGVDVYTTDTSPDYPIPVWNTAKKGAFQGVLFFTEENSLRNYLENSGEDYFLPVKFPLHLLDDKFQFSEWLVQHQECVVPYQELESIPSSYPVLVKAKCSWYQGLKYPRGWLCHSQEDLHLAKTKIHEQNLSLDKFFIQQWFDVSARDIFSVCGFFDVQDPRRNLLSVVQRILPHEEKMSCSAVVEVVKDPEFLIDRSTHILNNLAFSGPFELEYVFYQGSYFVLELNPRFWMQHALFLHADNGLLKRYLLTDKKVDWECTLPTSLLWIDSYWFTKQLLKKPWAMCYRLGVWKLQQKMFVFAPGFFDLFKGLIIPAIKRRVPFARYLFG